MEPVQVLSLIAQATIHASAVLPSSEQVGLGSVQVAVSAALGV
jgi:hypothetical protein